MLPLYKTSYSAIRRMMGIHEHLIKDRYPNLASLAGKFDVSNKTIQRDVAFMKEVYNLPIKYDQYYQGYRYTEAVIDMPVMKLTRQEVFALLLARKSIEQYQGTAFEYPLKSFFRKMLDHLSLLDLSSIEGINEFVTYLPNGINTCSYRMIETLAKASRNQVEVKAKYQAASGKKGRVKERILRPHRLVNHGGNWYLFAEDVRKEKVLCYHLARMASVRSTSRQFERKKRFSVEKSLANSFGIFVGDETHKVVVRFDSIAAPYVKEKRWNKSQKTKDRPDGGVDFQIEVNDLTEIKVWILGWGRHAKVLKPRSLVNEVVGELEFTRKAYRQTKSRK